MQERQRKAPHAADGGSNACDSPARAGSIREAAAPARARSCKRGDRTRPTLCASVPGRAKISGSADHWRPARPIGGRGLAVAPGCNVCAAANQHGRRSAGWATRRQQIDQQQLVEQPALGRLVLSVAEYGGVFSVSRGVGVGVILCMCNRPRWRRRLGHPLGHGHRPVQAAVHQAQRLRPAKRKHQPNGTGRARSASVQPQRFNDRARDSGSSHRPSMRELSSSRSGSASLGR